MAVPKKKRSSVMVRTRRSATKMKAVLNIRQCTVCHTWFRKHHIHNCK